jgi:hypothetical protein
MEQNDKRRADEQSAQILAHREIKHMRRIGTHRAELDGNSDKDRPWPRPGDCQRISQDVGQEEVALMHLRQHVGHRRRHCDRQQQQIASVQSPPADGQGAQSQGGQHRRSGAEKHTCLIGDQPSVLHEGPGIRRIQREPSIGPCLLQIHRRQAPGGPTGEPRRQHHHRVGQHRQEKVARADTVGENHVEEERRDEDGLQLERHGRAEGQHHRGPSLP